MTRRGFLVRSAGLSVAVTLGLTGCGPGSGSGQPRRATAPLSFANPLRVPAVLEPTIDASGQRVYALRLQSGRREFLPGQQTATWGINGDYLGPTLRASRGDRVSMQVYNQIGEASTLHWHGMRLPAVMDGGPHQMIEPDTTWTPGWTIDQPAATSWYHPHPHGTTAMHLYRGLAGMFLIDDADGPPLPSNYGVDDIPLILQDKKFAEDGAFADDPLSGTFGILGDHILVNGTYNPFLQISTELVRLRILNGSNARRYNIGFADRRRFQVIANDAGLLAAPVEVDEVSLTPGERAEVVVALAAGEQVVLCSTGGSADIDAGDLDLLKIVAAPQLAPSPAIPARLADIAPIAVAPGARVRRFRLNGSDAINGKEYDMTRIDEVVPAGAREVWEIENNVYAHNFHIHEVGFSVLDVGGGPPPAYASGLKDTVYVPGKSTVRLAVQFGRFVDPAAPYMYHCHILRHEDKGMMGQFVIVEPGTENQPLPPLNAAGSNQMHSH